MSEDYAASLPDVADWPYMTQKAAAKRLGVDVEFLSGMSGHSVPHGRTLRMQKLRTRAGNVTCVYNRDDIDALAALIAPLRD